MDKLGFLVYSSGNQVESFIKIRVELAEILGDKGIQEQISEIFRKDRVTEWQSDWEGQDIELLIAAKNSRNKIQEIVKDKWKKYFFEILLSAFLSLETHKNVGIKIPDKVSDHCGT